MIFELPYSTDELHTMSDGRNIYIGKEVPVGDLESLRGQLITVKTYKYDKDPWFGHGVQIGILSPEPHPTGDIILLDMKTKQPAQRVAYEIVYLMVVQLVVGVKA